MTIPQFSLSVVGAPYANRDGSNRSFEIKLLEPGDVVHLQPEPKNRYDEHAVAVLSKSGIQVGYINSERAPHIGVLLRAGHEVTAVFQEPTQWGCIIRIGVDEVALLPPKRAAASPERYADDDPGFEPDWIPPDE